MRWPPAVGYGGSIQAASDGPDRGSVFTVRLPVARAAEPAWAAAAGGHTAT